jgi:predicted dehydrogenase
MERIRLGVIGAGIMGERLLRAAQESEAVTISGVWDPEAQALDRVGAALPGLKRAGSADVVIEGADCVYIASPPASHLAYAGAALAAGRAVLCEKPLASDTLAARRFVEANQNARMALNFPFASSPAVARLAEWIKEGAVGAPRGFAIDLRFATWPRAWQSAAATWLDARAEGGFTREVASHFVFLCRRLLGPLTLGDHLAEFPEAGKSERRVRAALTAGGVPGILTGSVGETASEDENEWELRGVAHIRLRNWSIAERQRPDGSWAPDPDAMPQDRSRPLVLLRQLEGIARMTRGEPHHLATLAESIEVMELVEGIVGEG